MDPTPDNIFSRLPEVLARSPLNDLSSKQKAISLVAVGCAFLSIALGVLYVTRVSPTPMSDPLLAKVIERSNSIRSYQQHVETETTVSERPIRVVGDYSINHDRIEYFSKATTTLTIPVPGKSPENHEFTLTNIALANDVYSKIDTKSEVLKKTIPYSPAWRHFKKDDIPPELKNIAIPGPILDNMRILDEQGKYLLIVKKHGRVKLGTENLIRYTLKLSEETPLEGTLGSITNRIGKEGVVDIWIDEKIPAIRTIRFENPTYHSTTSISQIGAVERLSPPE